HGQIDDTHEDAERFTRSASESAGLSRSIAQKRSHQLELIGVIQESRLKMTWIYGENIYGRATIEKLAEAHLDSLRELISHCKSSDAGGFTPSDFPKARVSQKSLDQLLSGITKK